MPTIEEIEQLAKTESELSMNPYYVIVNKRIKEAINYAYPNIKLRRKVHISLIDLACKNNSKDTSIPIIFQNIWFCIHDASLERKQKNGKIVKIRALFCPVYIEPKKQILNLISNAVKIVGAYSRFGYLCGLKRGDTCIGNWLNLKNKPPITAIMKACQILKKDMWQEMHYCKIYGSSRNDTEIHFTNTTGSDLKRLVRWIDAEGNLSITSQLISITQKNTGETCLNELKETISNNFDIDKKRLNIYEPEKNIKRLEISSAPLKQILCLRYGQILCLRYGICLGHKSYAVRLRDVNPEKKEELLNVFTDMMGTEGSFSHYDFKNGFFYPQYSFCSSSFVLAQQMYYIAQILNYNPIFTRNKYSGTYIISIKNINNIVRCSFDIMPLLRHAGKIKSMSKLLSQDGFADKLQDSVSIKYFKDIQKTYLNSGGV